MRHHWGTYFYALKYDLPLRVTARIGMENLDRMTELGREIITIIARMELKTRSVPRIKTQRKRETKQWLAPVIKKKPSVGVDEMMALSARLGSR